MGKGVLVIAILVFALAGAAAWYILGGAPSAPPTAAPAIPDITAEEARKRIQSGEKAVLVDVRTPEEYAEINIPGSLFVPIQPPATFVERLKKVVPDKNTPVFLFCRSGQRSLSAAEFLASAGYKKVYNMGAIAGWPYEKKETPRPMTIHRQ